MNNKRHLFYQNCSGRETEDKRCSYKSYHLGNYRKFRRSGQKSGKKTKYAFLIISQHHKLQPSNSLSLLQDCWAPAETNLEHKLKCSHLFGMWARKHWYESGEKFSFLNLIVFQVYFSPFYPSHSPPPQPSLLPNLDPTLLWFYPCIPYRCS